MIRRLGELVRAGELDNTVNNTVHGWLHLWGERHPLLLQLTGNGGRGLRGRRLRFRATQSSGANHHRGRILQAQQIGPVGRMRLEPCEVPDQDDWRMRLLLEWFSQDGRVVVDVWEPSIEFILRADSRLAREQNSFANLFSVDQEEIGFCERACNAVPATLNDETSYDAGFNACGPAGERYAGMLHDVVSGSRDIPLNTLFDPPLRLLRAEQMNDRELSRELRKVLARLALHGIAIDVCRHFTKRQTYCWLLERILPGEEIFPELPKLGYVMHYMTSDSCSQCEKRE